VPKDLNPAKAIAEIKKMMVDDSLRETPQSAGWIRKAPSPVAVPSGYEGAGCALERYVRSQLANASSEERAALTELLELPDPLLADYLFGHTPATEPHVARLVAAIRDSRVGE